MGEGFEYEAYRQTALDEIRRRYYRLPDWLRDWCPDRVRVGRCPFSERYFPD